MKPVLFSQRGADLAAGVERAVCGSVVVVGKSESPEYSVVLLTDAEKTVKGSSEAANCSLHHSIARLRGASEKVLHLVGKRAGLEAGVRPIAAGRE